MTGIPALRSKATGQRHNDRCGSFTQVAGDGGVRGASMGHTKAFRMAQSDGELFRAGVVTSAD